MNKLVHVALDTGLSTCVLSAMTLTAIFHIKEFVFIIGSAYLLKQSHKRRLWGKRMASVSSRCLVRLVVFLMRLVSRTPRRWSAVKAATGWASPRAQAITLSG